MSKLKNILRSIMNGWLIMMAFPFMIPLVLAHALNEWFADKESTHSYWRHLKDEYYDFMSSMRNII